jgi:2-succinyl-5-enolpyruvyl-6-hydroxy-3-cyclohexene-1-carboxylate synthase
VSAAQSDWAERLLATLAEAGVRDVIISPGSRSTPLVWAACRNPALRRHALIDERSAGFFALGQARLSGAPSLLICTSGSAPSHYFPALIEARLSGIPMLVLSADRPFELQQCGAQQTIDQARLFGGYAGYHELGTPVSDRAATRALERIAWQAVAETLEPPRGPVHLNFRAKKPLEPALGERGSPSPGAGASATRRTVVRWRPAPPAPPLRADVDELVERLRASRCPLLVCGTLSPAESPSPELVSRFARASGAIVCPESVSQLRFGLDAEAPGALICDSYEWLLASTPLLQRATPDFLLQIGGMPLSTNLGRLLESSEQRELWICAEQGWPDPAHQSARIVRARPAELLRSLCEALEAHAPPEQTPERRLWREANTRARQLVSARLERSFGEPEAVQAFCEALPSGSILMLGNSLPPRLVDRYAGASARSICVLSQRGASGIDGLVAGTLGSASIARAPISLLCGDISFLHDVGSLWAARPERTQGAREPHPVVLVVINNAGGRIFDQLPMAKQAGADQHFWTTPHELELRHAAELYGLAYRRAQTRAELVEALHDAYARPEVCLVEVVVEPDSAARRLQQLAGELAAEWERVFPAS